jgi:hypothetical protein
MTRLEQALAIRDGLLQRYAWQQMNEICSYTNVSGFSCTLTRLVAVVDGRYAFSIGDLVVRRQSAERGMG